jgi:hypothetical protein
MQPVLSVYDIATPANYQFGSTGIFNVTSESQEVVHLMDQIGQLKRINFAHEDDMAKLVSLLQYVHATAERAGEGSGYG